MARTNRSGSTHRPTSGSDHSLISKIMLVVAIVAVVGLFVYLLMPNPQPPTQQMPVSVNVPVEPKSPEKLDIYLDMSVSMKGYTKAVDGNTYRDAITYLKSLYGSANSTVYLSNVEYEGNDLIDDMRHERLDYKSSSYLNNDIHRIIQTVNADTSKLAVFVTDGILSGDSEKIKADPQWTKVHRFELQDSIKEAFAGCKDVHASVYQFISPFDGEYYDMSNSHKRLPADRYFYVVALARPEHLADFKTKMEELQNSNKIKIRNQLHAIDQIPVTTGITVTGVLPTDNVYMVSNSTKLTTTADTFNVQKEIIPMYIDTQKAFKNHDIESELETMADNAVIKFNNRKVTLKGEGRPKYDENQHRICWYILKEEIPKDGLEVEILLPVSTPKWIERSKLDDDTDIWSPFADKSATFLLDNFINGINEGVAANDTIKSEYIYKSKVKFKAK